MGVNDAIRSFIEFIRNVTPSDHSDKGLFKDSTTLIVHENQTVILVGDDADKYREVKASVYEAISARRPVSRKAVDSILDDFFMRALASGDHRELPHLDDQLQAGIQRLKTALFEQLKSWEVRLTVEGLAPSGLPMRVGKVDFRFVDDEYLEELQGDLRQSTGTETGDVPHATQPLMNIVGAIRDKAIAVSTVNSVDRDAAIDTARHDLRITIDAINFFASRESMRGWVFLPGDTMPQAELVFASCTGSNLEMSFHRAGPIRCIPLNQLASRKGFARVSEILAKENPTDLEERILASLQWAGRAQVEARREEAFLFYAIALETLVLGRKTTMEITHQLATRCAHLAGGPSLDEKQLVVQKIRALYDLRSKIVHSGSLQIKEEELAQIREYSRLSLFFIIDVEPFREMKLVNDLEGWFKTRLLMGEVRSD